MYGETTIATASTLKRTQSGDDTTSKHTQQMRLQMKKGRPRKPLRTTGPDIAKATAAKMESVERRVVVVVAGVVVVVDIVVLVVVALAIA